MSNNKHGEHYHYGFNMPGYMPDSDPMVTSDWELAYDALMFDLDLEIEDSFNDGTPYHLTDRVKVEVERTARYGMPFYYRVRKYAYWIEVCEHPSCVTLEDELSDALDSL